MTKALDLDPRAAVGADPVRTRLEEQPRPRVLHVTEALGGVPVSIQHFIDATPYADHYYVALTLRSHVPTAVPAGLAGSVVGGVKSPLAWRRAVAEQVAQWQPTHLHFHSSFAGLWGRLRRFGRQRVLYTPHCYAFERGDLPHPVRRSLRVVEALLERRTDVVAAISDREAVLTRQLRRGSRARVVTAFNPVGADVRAPRRGGIASTPPVVGTMGRVTAQKDPAFFLRVVEEVRALRPGLALDWVWVGQGDEEVEARLRASGVRVTGWLSAADAAAELAAIDLYVHTAAWEGYPLAVTEALTAGIPVALRSVPALPSVMRALGLEQPVDLAQRIVRLVEHGPDDDYLAAVEAVAGGYSGVVLASVCSDLYR